MNFQFQHIRQKKKSILPFAKHNLVIEKEMTGFNFFNFYWMQIVCLKKLICSRIKLFVCKIELNT